MANLQHHVLFCFDFSFRALILICTFFFQRPSPLKTCINNMKICFLMYSYCWQRACAQKFSKILAEGAYGEWRCDCLGRNQSWRRNCRDNPHKRRLSQQREWDPEDSSWLVLNDTKILNKIVSHQSSSPSTRVDTILSHGLLYCPDGFTNPGCFHSHWCFTTGKPWVSRLGMRLLWGFQFQSSASWALGSQEVLSSQWLILFHDTMCFNASKQVNVNTSALTK